MSKLDKGTQELLVQRAPEAEGIARVNRVVEGSIYLREFDIALLLKSCLADSDRFAAGLCLVGVGNQLVEQVPIDGIDVEVDEIDAG